MPEARRGLPQQKGKRKEDAAKVPLTGLAVELLDGLLGPLMWWPEAGQAPSASWLSPELCFLTAQTVAGSKKGRSAFEDITNKKDESKAYPTAQKVRGLGGPIASACFASFPLRAPVAMQDTCKCCSRTTDAL